MKFPLSSFLFASVVLGHHHRGAHRSRSLNHAKRTTDAAAVLSSTTWSGAMWEKDNEAFTFVTGTFTVPVPSGASGDAASMWVGINGNSCVGGGMLQTGVDVSVTDQGHAYGAWYEWAPAPTYPFVNVNVSAGDVIRATVNISSPTSGIATIENLSNNQTQSAKLDSTLPLCQRTAQWIIEDQSVYGGNPVPFANFGTVNFTDAVAIGRSGTRTPEGADIIFIEQDKVLTSVSTEGGSIVVKHL